MRPNKPAAFSLDSFGSVDDSVAFWEELSAFGSAKQKLRKNYSIAAGLFRRRGYYLYIVLVIRYQQYTVYCTHMYVLLDTIRYCFSERSLAYLQLFV